MDVFVDFSSNGLSMGLWSRKQRYRVLMTYSRVMLNGCRRKCGSAADEFHTIFTFMFR